ncbi:hypothetical protein Nepgr_021349 [Nepenthes gracilis]|uniref:Bromo domain-containing protein n=1 Tax=Nepenthes gracilis TaxID=150966 RepID=A0AAD3SY04_NEPGR|nr:hypothetical protein Nepgr_021349 [Nepenthes gracilis]
MFEELRKRRVAKLKRALEKSEDSIGTLEMKLESLKAGKRDCSYADYSSSCTECNVQFSKSQGHEFSCQDTSKDGLSAGSFTWSPQYQATGEASSEHAETRPVFLLLRGENSTGIKRKRGPRKRREFSKGVKEGSMGENFLFSSCNFGVPTTLDCDEIMRFSGENDPEQCTNKEKEEDDEDLRGILDSFMKNEHVSMFRRRLESQKRAKYKKIIHQHMDLEMVRSRIARRSITSAQELFCDLLLIANNALIFYAKGTREHQSATLLRDLVARRLQQPYKPSGNAAAATLFLNSVIQKLVPSKPRSARPRSSRFPSKIINTKIDIPVSPNIGKVPGSTIDSPPSIDSLPQTKRHRGPRAGKVGWVNGGSAGCRAGARMAA